MSPHRRDADKAATGPAVSVSGELASTLDWAPGFICILMGPDHVVQFVNRSHRKLFQSEEWLGRPAREAVPEVTAQGFHDLLDAVYRSGERFVGTDLPVRFRPAGKAEEVTLYHDFVYEPIRDADGQIVGVFCEGLDVTSAHNAREELKLHLERQSFRLSFERDLAEGGAAIEVMTRAARLLSDRWSATRVAFTERSPEAADRLCRRVFDPAVGKLAETVVDRFPVDLSDVRSGSVVRHDAASGPGSQSWEIVVPRLAGTVLVGTVEIAFAGADAPADSDVALLEDTSRRLWETVDRLRAEAERDRFFDASLDLLCIASLDDARIRRASRSFADILGWEPSELVGMLSRDLVHPDDRDVMADIGASLEGGGQLHGFEQRIRCKDGSYRWINWSSTPVPEENLLFGVGRDVTERREFDRQRDIFIAELNHRVKNTLAVVQAMASQTFRVEGGDPSAAIAKYQKRISAIALAHDLLTNNNWGVVSLGELVRGALGRAREKAHQIEVEGPELFVSPRQAVAFSLALNELLENSRAHGSLKAPSGRVSITWMHEDCDRFSFIWQESGSTARAAPEGPGFGTLLLRSLGEEFDGASRMEFGTGGVAFRLTGNAQN